MDILTIQIWIWNIGGFLFTILFILLVLAYMLHLILHYSSGWHKKENRDSIWYYIRHQKEIQEYIKRNKK